MTATIWIIPGSPALVEELSLHDAPSHRLRTHIRSLAAEEAAGSNRPIDIVCSLDERWRTGHTGSLQAWGAPQVRVRGGNHLGELVARYALGDPEVREVRAHIGTPDPQAVTVVVVDGSAGLTARAPLALVPGAQELHQRMCEWLGGGEGIVDTQMPGVVEPALWHELAELTPQRAMLVDADDTLGVGRYVAVWEC